MKRKTTIGSGLIITSVSLFAIFLLFRIIDYNNRSKFNFREYDIGSGKDKYKKTVYQYNKDMIEGGVDSVRTDFDDHVDDLKKKGKKGLSFISNLAEKQK